MKKISLFALFSVLLATSLFAAEAGKFVVKNECSKDLKVRIYSPNPPKDITIKAGNTSELIDGSKLGGLSFKPANYTGSDWPYRVTETMVEPQAAKKNFAIIGCENGKFTLKQNFAGGPYKAMKILDLAR